MIDDFGTAYSSLAQLKNFPLNVLKIDRSLTVKLGGEPEDEAIVSAMIQLAQALGWAVAAQGWRAKSNSRCCATWGAT